MAIIEQVGAREILDCAAIRPSRWKWHSRTARSPVRPCRQAPRPVSTRPSSCVTAATATAEGRPEGPSTQSRPRSPRRSSGTRPTTSASSTRPCSTSTAPPTSPPGRQRAARRVVGRRQDGCRVRGAAAVPLRRRPQRAHPAGADDEHHQRRRPCRFGRGRAGVHDRPIGAPTFAEALRWGAEVYHSLKSVLKSKGPVHRTRRRGRVRPQCCGHHRGAEHHRTAITGAGLRPGPTSCWRWTWRPPSSTRREGYAEGKHRPLEEMAQFCRQTRRRLPAGVDRGSAVRRMTGRAGSRSPRRSVTRCSSSATICSSPTLSAWSAASSRAHRQRAAGEGEPDRHADRDLDAVGLAHSNGTRR